VESGVVQGLSWRIGSTALTERDVRCLYGDDELFRRDVVCFSDWRPELGSSWRVLTLPGSGGRPVTAVLGVAPAAVGPVPVGRVAVLLEDGTTVPARAVRTATDPQVRFFALVVDGTARVSSVTVLAATGAPLAAADTDADEPVGCTATANSACATPGD
jgi:hypothetical protein